MRLVARMAAFVVLVAVLFGVPAVLVRWIDPTARDWRHLRSGWSLRSLDGTAVFLIAGVVFLALWSWFACTAIAEAWRVLRHRRTGDVLAPVERTPGGWVKGVVRFVVLSSATASIVGGLASHGVSAVVRPSAKASAEVHRASATERTANEPVAPPPSTPVPQVAASSLLSYLSGMGTALLLAAGVVGMIESRRRRHWRSARDAIAVAPHDPALTYTEQTLRAIAADERLAGVDVAIRSVARDLARQESRVLAVSLSPSGSVRLVVDGVARPSVPDWTMEGEGTWSLDAGVSLDRLALAAGDVAPPCPALAHLGVTHDGDDVFVDLESLGTLRLDTPFADDVARSIAAGLVFSPFMQGAHVVACGADLLPLTEGDSLATAVRADTLDDGLRIARRLIGSTPSTTRTSSTFTLRVAGTAGECWEPAVVVATGERDSSAVQSVAPSSALALVTDGRTDGRWTLSFDGEGHLLSPVGWRLRPVGLGHHDVADVVALVHESSIPLEPPARLLPPSGFPAPFGEVARSVSIAGGERALDEPSPFVEPPWSLMVRVLGPVSVVDRDGTAVQFERSKSLELVVWLALHRERPTRSAARTALWDLDVRAATFANVVSDARRGLARAVLPLEGDEWIARTLTEELPLHPQVITDAEMLAARLAHARRQGHAAAIGTLRPGVELLRALPLSGTSFAWSDAEGHTSALVMLSMSAATELAERCLAVGDVDGVFWATGQGLKVLAGHEELISLRMRAHAGRGDLAGVRSEWASYERALAADSWSVADPAPKLLSLRQSLLG